METLPGAWVSYTAVVPRANGYEHRPAKDARSTRSDNQGRFRLAPLEPATYRLLARTDRGSVEAPVSVRLALLGTHSGVTLNVVRGSTVIGQVEDDQGSPVQHASVEVMLRAGYRFEAEVDSDGRFEVPGLQPGMYRFRARERRLAISDSEGRFAIAATAAARYRIDVTGPSGLGLAEAPDLAADADVVLVLQELSSISGQVRLRNAAVRRFEVAPPGSGLFPVLFADDDGTFELTDLKPGPATVVVFAPEGIGRARVELRPGANTDLVVTLEPWARATARVVDEDGVPVMGAFVDVSTQVPRKDGAGSTTTDADGRFELDGIGPGRTIFKVRKGGSTTRSEVQNVDPGDNLDLGALVL